MMRGPRDSAGLFTTRSSPANRDDPERGLQSHPELSRDRTAVSSQNRARNHRYPSQATERRKAAGGHRIRVFEYRNAHRTMH